MFAAVPPIAALNRQPTATSAHIVAAAAVAVAVAVAVAELAVVVADRTARSFGKERPNLGFAAVACLASRSTSQQ